MNRFVGDYNLSPIQGKGSLKLLSFCFLKSQGSYASLKVLEVFYPWKSWNFAQIPGKFLEIETKSSLWKNFCFHTVTEVHVVNHEIFANLYLGCFRNHTRGKCLKTPGKFWIFETLKVNKPWSQNIFCFFQLLMSIQGWLITYYIGCFFICFLKVSTFETTIALSLNGVSTNWSAILITI